MTDLEYPSIPRRRFCLVTQRWVGTRKTQACNRGGLGTFVIHNRTLHGFFNVCLGPVTQRKSANTAKNSALKLVKMPTLNAIC